MKYIKLILAMIDKERIIFLRYPARILGAIVFPLFLTLIFAFTAILYQPTGGINSRTFAPEVFLGMVIFMIVSISSDAPMRITEEQQQGTLESILLSPAPRFSSVLGVLFVRAGFLVGIIVLYYFIVLISFGNPALHNPIWSTLLFLGIIAQSFGFGIFMSGFTITAKETGLRAAFFLPFFVIILSGVFIPVSSLPETGYYIALMIPFTYNVDALRGVAFSTNGVIQTIIPIEYEIIISLISAVAFPYIGVKYYLKKERDARRSGTLLEY